VVIVLGNDWPGKQPGFLTPSRAKSRTTTPELYPIKVAIATEKANYDAG
jgi:hypothetical protein